MKPLQLNRGGSFAQPYESSYARLRRYLTANPGVALQSVQAYARRDVGAVSGRMWRAQVPATGFVSEHDLVRFTLTLPCERHCARCAAHLYHTDLFRMPWLEACPIHHEAFTERCPVCAQPWPTIAEMAHRDCPGCARMPWLALSATRTPLDLRPIADLYRFIAIETGYVILNGRRGQTASHYTDRWWHEVEVDAPEFPAFQARRYPLFSRRYLESLHVRLDRAIRVRRCRIHAPAQPPEPKSRLLRADKRLPDQSQPVPARCQDEYQVMRAILAWIERQSSPHQPHIIDYRYAKPWQFTLGPEACPYCLALSLWYFHVTARHFDAYYGAHLNQYPFANAYGFDGFFEVSEPYLHAGHDEVYYADRSFTAWFYRRGLELLYLGIVRFAFEMAEDYGKWRIDPDQFDVIVPRKDHYRPHYEGACAARRIGHVLTFCYEHEHPLAHFCPPPMMYSAQRCRRFFAWAQKDSRFATRDFDFSIALPDRFGYASFRRLHERYRALLEAM